MAEGRLTTPWMKLRICTLLAAAVLCSTPATAQLSSSAVRVLGQPDFRQNGFNSPESTGLFAPSYVALDARDGMLHVYVTDRGNRRVLGWLDLAGLQSGAPPDLVLGQLDLTSTGAFGIGVKGFGDPTGIAVDPSNGNVYVADAGAHRVTRYRSPFDAAATLEPDKVYGQLTFTSTTANPGGVSAGTLRGPTGLTIDADGNLWIADTDNNRVLQYSSASLNDEFPVADMVLGQFDFGSAGFNAGVGGLSAFGLRGPSALAFGPNGSLFVADTVNSRVLVFDAPFTMGKSATRVIGQTSLTVATTSAAGLPWSLRRVNGLAVSADGKLYAAMREDNRVLVFDDAATASGQQNASSVLGQKATDESLPNSGTTPKASATGLVAPGAVTLGPDGSVLIADTGNNRVIVYEDGLTASLVLGQADFVANSANRADSVGVGGPAGIAIDYSTEGFPLYASDTQNHRVLAWRSTLRFANGAPADLVIGQIGFNAVFANSGATTPSASSLDTPKGLAVNSEGDLFVADSGNNRVLRFRRPFDQNGKPQATLVLGQSAFFTKGSAFINAGTTNSPSDVEIGPDGRIYVADTANNRVLEFASDSTNGVGAVRVFGQPDTQTGALAGEVSASSMNAPSGIGVDATGTLYVADNGNHRVLLFPLGPEVPTAGSNPSKVVGQASFQDSGAANSQTRLRNPADVAVGSNGAFFVADSGNNRILEFQGGLFLPTVGASAVRVLGQPNFNGRNPNPNATDGRATAEGLSQPLNLATDRNGMLYVADAGNNRIVEFVKPAVAVSAATFLPGVSVAAGALTSVFGVDLSTETAAADAIPLPTELGGSFVEVGVDEVRAPLIFVSPGQFNLQIPPATAVGIQQLRVRLAETDELIGGGFLGVAGVRPGLFTLTQNGVGFAVAVNQDGSFNSPENPAPRGSVITLYGTGQGPTNPVVPAGEAAPGGGLANTIAVPKQTAAECLQPNAMCVVMANKIAETQFSGLAPGFVGLWQLNVKVPEGEDFLGGPLVEIRAVVNQVTTNDNVFISTQ